MNILLILAVVFGTLILVRLANVASIASKLSGENEEAEQESANRWNSIGMLTFLIVGLITMFYLISSYAPLTLPKAASEHGAAIDKLMSINWTVLFITFLVTQILLFSFAFKYRFNKNRRAFYFHDNNKLEAIWTIIPTVVLATLIVTGLREWNDITNKSDKMEGLKIQIYAKQFDFTARYAGTDKNLGRSNFRYISDSNPLGVDSLDQYSADDIIAKELVMPKGAEIELVINSRDVIHSVYLPHFRVQMNAVPGMTTRFSFKPTMTTAEMQKETQNPKFEYIMLCNKVCGVAHYNMKMPIRVVEMDEYQDWLKSQPLVFPAVADSAAPTSSSATAEMMSTSTN
ncbi:MAG: cytochrome c oxidase subunit II [Bacteroidota bacterium]